MNLYVQRGPSTLIVRSRWLFMPYINSLHGARTFVVSCSETIVEKHNHFLPVAAPNGTEEL